MDVESGPPSSGRRRYDRSGKKHLGGSRSKQSSRNSKSQRGNEKEEDVIRLPEPTLPDGPRPTYFSCRHTYEDVLIQEIQEMFPEASQTMQLTSPAPGLVECLPHQDSLEDSLPILSDPVYALQSLPECVVVSAESIKGLSDAIQRALLGSEEETADSRRFRLRTQLREAPRASLAIHGLVPGMFKGQKTPKMGNRIEKIVEALSKELKSGYPAARKERIEDQHEGTEGGPKERWLLQVLLLAPDLAAASLVVCQALGPTSTHYWPNWHLPAGMAKVDIVETMPSSAYRKLMEALECMRIRPHPSITEFCVDLGACPGGWTAVLRRFLDCSVIGVDRSPLDPSLMNDPEVEFYAGDAFTFEPARAANEEKEVWMVSDVIAYPERVIELLNRWCGGHWATHLVVTMKFQGTEPSFGDLAKAIALAQSHGYFCRAKHFFNNKNEVTLMLIQEKASTDKGLSSYPLETGVLGTPMYEALLPTRN